MNAKKISIYVDGKLVLMADNLVYDEENGRRVKFLPPGAVFSGKVGAVMTLDELGTPVKSAGEGSHELEIHCELW